MGKQLKILLTFAFVAALCVTSLGVAVAENVLQPTKKSDGNVIKGVTYPEAIGEGIRAEVVIPSEKTVHEKELFIPEIIDYDDFFDMENPGDFSVQYDYADFRLTRAYGNFSVSDGKYTATTDGAIYADLDAETAFPYGTLSADVKNNGGDSGFIIGLSANATTFWEGYGIVYYFVFKVTGEEIECLDSFEFAVI